MQAYKNLLRSILDNGIMQYNTRTGKNCLALVGYQFQVDTSEYFPAITIRRLPFKNMRGELLGFLRGYTNAADFRQLGCNFWNKNANETNAWVNSPFRKGTDDLGPIYGKQWRSWDNFILVDKDHVNQKEKEGYSVLTEFTNSDNKQEVMYRSIDQLEELIHNLKTKPFSRRHIISAWNVSDLPDESESIARNILKGKMALPPCHTLFQFYVTELTQEEQEKYWDKNKYSKPPKHGLSCQLYQR